MKTNPSNTIRIDGERPSTTLRTALSERSEPNGRSRTIKVAASILSADFSCLSKEIAKAKRAGADMLHIDVMDGHFVPNITIGPVVVKYIRKVSSLPLDVHLMIEKPEKFTDDFISAGSDMLTVHIETISPKRLTLYAKRLRAKKIKLGISLNPHTPLSRIKRALNFIDFVLIMSVNPGFSGQTFIYESLAKIKQLRSVYNGDIAVDGGINEETAKLAVNAGANILAAGSYVFGAKDIRLAIERLKNA